MQSILRNHGFLIAEIMLLTRIDLLRKFQQFDHIAKRVSYRTV